MGLERIDRNVNRERHPGSRRVADSGSMSQFSYKTGSINFGSEIEAWMLKRRPAGSQHDGGADFTESALGSVEIQDSHFGQNVIQAP